MTALLLCTLLAATAAAAGAVTPPAQTAGCPVSIEYIVQTEPQAEREASAPIFVPILTLRNNQTGTIPSWRLAATLPFNATIEDVFVPRVTLLTPGSSDVLLESSAAGPGIPAGGQLDLSFLGTHLLQASGECCTTYHVGPLDHVVFNGMQCPLLASTGGDMPAAPAAETGGAAAALPGAAAPAAAPATESGPVLQPEVQVDYTAIEYLGQPLTATFSQLLLRVRKVGTPGALPLSQLSMLYFFASPVEGAFASAASDPGSFFEAQCEWATTGCENVHVAVQLAAAEVPGADFALNVSFSDQAGTLLSDDRSPLFFDNNAVDAFNVLLTLTTKKGVLPLNATQDYSYMDTPELPIESNRTLIPRRALPNPRILAYIGGEPAWGTPPPGFHAMADQAAGSASAGTVAALLAGVAWSERENAAHKDPVRRATVHAVYCCQEQAQWAAGSPAPEVALLSAGPPHDAGGP